MVVYAINKDNVTVVLNSENNEFQIESFLPECILQYKYAGLITHKRSGYNISLN